MKCTFWGTNRWLLDCQVKRTLVCQLKVDSKHSTWLLACLVFAVKWCRIVRHKRDRESAVPMFTLANLKQNVKRRYARPGENKISSLWGPIFILAFFSNSFQRQKRLKVLALKLGSAGKWCSVETSYPPLSFLTKSISLIQYNHLFWLLQNQRLGNDPETWKNHKNHPKGPTRARTSMEQVGQYS